MMEALKEFETLLSKERTVTDPHKLALLARASYQREMPFIAALYPETKEEVQRIVEIANRYNTPLHPVSCGKNTGYGSKSPYQPNSVLVDLSRMNKILDFSEALGWVRVEPGVTFDQLFVFLRENHSKLMLSTVGSHPSSSVVGNALERGNGSGPYGERHEYIAAIEAVAGTGEIVRSGLAAWNGARSAPLYREGPGVALIELFCRSNFAIVTELVLWLSPLPHFMEITMFYLDATKKLSPIIDAFHDLRFSGHIHSFDMGFFNRARIEQGMKMGKVTWPLESVPVALENPAPLPFEWAVIVCIYARTKEQLDADINLVNSLLLPHASSSKKARKEEGEIEAILDYFGHIKQGMQVEKPFEFLPLEAGQLGIPLSDSIKIAYCKKSAVEMPDFDPERDLCGILMLTAPVPFEGAFIEKIADITRECLERHLFSPSFAFPKIKERTCDLILFIVWDREEKGADERAELCLKELIKALVKEGVIPTRLPAGFYECLPKRDDQSSALLRGIKERFDPQNLIDPGRFL